MKKFFPHVTWDHEHAVPLAELRQVTRDKTEIDLFNAELELERALANRNMYRDRLERLK